MNFDYKLLRQPTVGTLLFIQKTENEKAVLFTNDGKTHSITSEFEHKLLTKWKSGKYRVFVWKERIHDKKTDTNNIKRYYDHYLYRYFLVPGEQKIVPIASKDQFDFGFHRVKDQLTAVKAIHFLTVTEEDLTGYSH